MDLFTVLHMGLTVGFLTFMEVVMNIDNQVMINIVTGDLPVHIRNKARKRGMALAMITRIIFLCFANALMGITKPIFTMLNVIFSWKSLILLGGGLFLIAKSTHEIHKFFDDGDDKKRKSSPNLYIVYGLICWYDIFFSMDSIITAVGMAQELWIMITAVVLSVAIMIALSNKIGHFIDTHRSIKILALAFLILIGGTLVAEGVGQEIEKGYVYTAMGFALTVETINIRLSAKKHQAIHHS